MKKKTLFISTALIITAAALAWAYSSYKSKNAPPVPVEYSNAADIRFDIERLEGLKKRGGLSWQDSFRLGAAYFHAGRFKESADTLEEVSRARPDFPDTYESLGMAYYRLERFDSAAAAWQKVSPPAEYLKDMIDTAKKKAEFEKRAKTLEKAIEEYKKQGAAPQWQMRFELAVIYLGLNRPDPAIKELNEIIRVRTNIPDVYDTLARVYAMKGDFKRAAAAEKKALNLRPGDEDLKKRIKELEKLKLQSP